MVEPRAQRLGLADLARGELEPLLGVPDNRVLHLVTMLGQERAVARREAQGALHLEDLPRVGDVGFAVLDPAAERLERRALRVEHLRHAAVDRQPAEVAAPGDARVLEVAAELAAEARTRLGDRDR